MTENLPVVPDQIYELVANNNIYSLSPQQRVEYIGAICSSLKLNPLTQPIQFIRFQGNKDVPYFTRGATDDLRKLNNISIEITRRERIDDIYVVEAKATTPKGRTDIATGAIVIGHLKGDQLANALMKAETKAKRRVTLSICGLGLLDESELDTISDAVKVEPADPNQTSTEICPESQGTSPVESSAVSGTRFSEVSPPPLVDEPIPYGEDEVPEFGPIEEREITGTTKAKGRKWRDYTNDDVMKLALSPQAKGRLSERSKLDLTELIKHRGLEELLEAHKEERKTERRQASV